MNLTGQVHQIADLGTKHTLANDLGACLCVCGRKRAALVDEFH